MKIYKKDGCVVAIDGQENYLVKYDDSFYKMNEEQFKDCFGDGELTFFREIKDSPVICFCMTGIIIATVAYYFANEKYVIIDSNFVWSNFILVINIFIHELGHILLLKLFLPGSTIKMGFKIFFIYPAFYVDTSNTYLLPKYKRIAVYLAGNFTNCLYLIMCNIFMKGLNVYNYLIISTILINFLPIIKSDGYYAFMSLFGKYTFNKSKMRNYIEDTVRGIAMFIVLYLLSCINTYL